MQNMSIISYFNKLGLLIFPFWSPHFVVWTPHFGWTPRLNYTVARYKLFNTRAYLAEVCALRMILFWFQFLSHVIKTNQPVETNG